MIRNEQYKSYITLFSEKLSNVVEKNDTKTIMISGASGMVGTVIVDILLNMNDNYKMSYMIYGLGRGAERAHDMFEIYEKRVDFKFTKCDINEKIPEIGVANYIIHAASNTHPIDYSGDPIGTIASNVIGTNNLLKYAVEHNCNRFVFFVISGSVW